MAIPPRTFGATGVDVSILGVDGAHIGLHDDEVTGIRIIHEAFDAGVDFMDKAWDYNDGESERRMGKALSRNGYRPKVFLMTKDCAHDRRAHHSILEQSLKRLKTNYLDSWQISGIDSLEVLYQNPETASGFTPLTSSVRDEILAKTALAGANGEYELFKTSRKFEGNEGRMANNYPLHPSP